MNEQGAFQRVVNALNEPALDDTDKGGCLRTWLLSDTARPDDLLARSLPHPSRHPAAGSSAIPRLPGSGPLVVHANPNATSGAGVPVLIFDPHDNPGADPRKLASALGLTPAPGRPGQDLHRHRTPDRPAAHDRQGAGQTGPQEAPRLQPRRARPPNRRRPYPGRVPRRHRRPHTRRRHFRSATNARHPIMKRAPK